MDCFEHIFMTMERGLSLFYIVRRILMYAFLVRSQTSIMNLGLSDGKRELPVYYSAG